MTKSNLKFHAKIQSTMKMICLFTLAALPFSSLFAQTEKGAQPLQIPQSAFAIPHSTRAVVIGISDYQHKSIPDLQFAHEDAKAFADWLASPSGGRVPAENVVLLLNEKATAGQVISALDGLAETCLEGDQILIYFSGHGDIEKVTTRQNGYLLCHDAPATTYPAGGCVPLGYLQDIVSTISDRKSRVILITDACHAGKLAGSAVNGTQTTNAALARQFANEVKIMSCQANELALEGKQWGNGRGVFSYHLIDGLMGLADRNADQTVSLLELGRYLEDKVTAEAAPHPQTPVALGDRAFSLAQVDEKALAEWLKKKAAGHLAFEPIAPRGFENEGDSATYRAFLAAIERGDFLAPADSSAEFFYQKLLAAPSNGSMHGLFRRNYAAALQDEIQQAINALLDNDPYENNAWRYRPERYAQFPTYLERALDLLGAGHYMAASLRAKKAYFEGYQIAQTLVGAESDPARRDSLREAAKRKYLAGIADDPDAAYLYFAIGDLYFANNPYRTDSLVRWCKLAFERSPGWIAPVLSLFYEYRSGQGNMVEAEKWLNEAEKVLPNSFLVTERKEWLFLNQGRIEEALALCEKMISDRPDLFNGYGTMGRTIFMVEGDFLKVEKQARKAIELNPNLSNWAFTDIGASLLGQRKTDEAIAFLTKNNDASELWERTWRWNLLAEAFAQKSEFEKAERFAQKTIDQKGWPYSQTQAFLALGKIRVQQNRLPEAIAFFEKSLAADPTPNALFIFDWAWLGEVARLQNRTAEAEAFFKKGLAYSAGSVWEELPAKEEAHFLYGQFLLHENRDAEAAEHFQKSLEMRRKGFWGEYGFALLSAKKGEKKAALDWLEKSLENFWPDEKAILEEPLFSKIRKTKRFGDLVAKHFLMEK